MEVPILLPKIFNHPFTYLNNKKIKNLKLVILLLFLSEKKRIGVVWDKIKKTEKKLN